jgi:hypothetical protein
MNPNLKIHLGRFIGRSVGEMVEKVALWRNLQFGFQSKDEHWHKMSPQEAADKVGLLLKTLWYYWKEIIACRQLGYDFNEKKDDNAGDLNKFLRE